MTTAAQIVQPDLEAWVWQQIRHLPGVTSFCFAVNPASGWLPWHLAYSVQIDARAKGKQAARDLAEQVRQIITGLPGQPWPEGVVTLAQATDGPFWLPDPDAGPRYVARYEIRCHPPQVTP